MFNKKINGVSVISYNPTPLEQINSRGEAIKTRERIQKSLYKNTNKKGLRNAYKEFLEITERYNLNKENI